MSKPNLLYLAGCVLMTIAFSNCISIPQQAYYVSPLNGNSEDYHAQPLLRDSVKTAIYARTAYYGGSANDLDNDHVSGWNLSLYAAHHSDNIQYFGGLDLSLGSYNVGSWDTSYRPYSLLSGVQWLPPGQSQNLRAFAGPKSFGAVGVSGGVDYAVPFPGGGEWRAIGIETSLQREFGDYLSFRQQLPDSLVTLVVRDRFFGTLGGTTEIIWRFERQGEWGVRLAVGGVLGPDYNHLHIYDNVDQKNLVYTYTDLSVHFTYGHFTAYFQTDNSKKASTGRIGLIYRMGDTRLAEPKRRYYSR